MKRIVAIIMIFIMMFSLGACGNNEPPMGDTNDDTSNFSVASSTESNKKDSVDSNVAFTQSETFLGYTIMCPENCSVSNSKYGKTFSYESFVVIIEAPAAVGSLFAVTGFEDVVSNCEEYVCGSLESGYSFMFKNGATEQIVSEEDKVTVNGVEALRVSGVFNNTRDNTETEYVAYYFLAPSEDGTIYPVYIVGVPFKEASTDLGIFMDDMAAHIEK